MGVEVARAAQRQRPVHLVVDHEQRALAGGLAAAVLVDDGEGELAQRVGGERGAGGVERAVEHEEPRAAQVGQEVRRRGQERVLGPARHGDAAGGAHVHVVVVVPRRDRVHDGVPGLAHGPVRAVQQRPRAAGHEDRREREVEALRARQEPLDRRAELGEPVGRRVVGLPLGVGRGDGGLEPGRDAELGRREVAHRQVHDRLAVGDHLPHLARDLEDLGADEAQRHGGEAAARERFAVGGEELRDVEGHGRR
jgi:hypothetical protein